MLIVDIETSGLCPRKNSILSIGAVDYDTPQSFYTECAPRVGAILDARALEINGSVEEELLCRRITPVGLYESFLVWAVNRPNANEKDGLLLAGHNIGKFDMQFLLELHEEANAERSEKLRWPFGYRTVDLHSVAYARLGESLSHEQICRKLGLPEEPKPHNALAGALSEKAALKILLQ